MSSAGPTTTAGAPAGPSIEWKLRRAWHKQRSVSHLRGLSALAVAMVGLALANLLIDWLLVLPPAGRMVLLALDAAVILWALYRYWWQHLHRFNPSHVALQVERHFPDLRSLLISYVQFGRDLGEESGISPALLEATRRQARQATATLDFRSITRVRDLRRLLIVASVSVVLFAAVAVWLAPYFRVLALRLIQPTATLQYPTRTRVIDVTGPLVVRQGDPIELQAVAEGVVPRFGSLFIRSGESGWEQVTLERGEGDVFTHELSAVYQTFEYELKIGDFRTRPYQVTVVPPPHAVSVEVEQLFPAYTNRTPEVADTLNVDVPQGTELRWRVAYDRPIRNARMLKMEQVLQRSEEDPEAPPQPVLRESPLTEASISADGRTLSAAYTADESFRYRFTFEDAEHGFAYDEQVQHSVHVIPDAEPDVEIVAPRVQQQLATRRKVVDLRYRAGDDYGVVSAAIVYSLNGGDEARIELNTYDNRRIVEGEFEWHLRQAVPELEVGDELTWAVEVVDNHEGEGGAQRGRSAPRRLSVVSVAEYQRYMFEQLRGLTSELQDVRETETESAEAIGELKDTELPQPEAEDAE